MTESEGSGAVDGGAVDGTAVLARVAWRIIPLLAISYMVAFMDRSNISFAARTMNADLGFSATVYGIGGGMFFLSYALFEIPSNILLERVGARRWIARIMITWGVLAAGMMFVHDKWSFYGLRFLLGMAEAGFFPGVIFYLSLWFPRAVRGRALSRFYVSGPLTRVVLGIVSVWLLALDGVGGLRGWQWLYVGEGLPAVAVGLLVLWFLPDGPQSVAWLSPAEKGWLAAQLDRERGDRPGHHGHRLAALRHPMVLQLGLIGFLTTAAYYTFTLSEPQVLGQALGLGPAATGYLISAFGLLAGGAMVASGWLSDRAGRRLPFLVGSIVLVLASYILFAMALPGTALIAYALFVMGWGTVTLSVWMLCTDLVPPAQMAVGTAMINTLSQTGAFIGPILWGMARDATGSFRLGFGGLAVVEALALACALILVRAVRAHES